MWKLSFSAMLVVLYFSLLYAVITLPHCLTNSSAGSRLSKQPQ